MAPPSTFRRSAGMPSRSRQYTTCTANASFSSHNHFVGLTAGDREAAKKTERLDFSALRFAHAHQHARRRAVRELARVAGGYRSVGVQHRLELRESVRRGLRSIALVAREHDRFTAADCPVLVGQIPDRAERHDLDVEPTGRLCRRRAPLAFQCVLVVHIATDAIALGHVLRRLDHRRVKTGTARDNPLVARAKRIAMVLHERHRFDTAGHRDVSFAAADAIRGDRDRIEARCAFTIERCRRHADGQARANRSLPRDVAAGGAFLPRATEQHVVDLLGSGAGAPHGGVDHVAGHRRAVRVVERAAERFADASPGRRYDDCVLHH